jgi:FlaG/FlaF family flagellin (archaellin)
MKNEAVSPVIGVLLMLTLTLIIAAIVNSYAGGLIDTEPKAPSATIHVTYSQEHGMEIRHVSGDPIPTSSVKVLLRPSETIGRTAPQYLSEINKQFITNLSGELSWASGISSFKVGDISYILNTSAHPNIKYIQNGEDPSDFWINNTINKGNTFFLELYYKNTMISRNEVLIEE